MFFVKVFEMVNLFWKTNETTNLYYTNC